MADRELARVRTFARVMDNYYLDPILGFLLPGVGDLVGSALGFYLVSIALRRRHSPVIIARMLMNLALDAVIGVLPIVGDVADAAFKANDKNLALLEQRPTGRASPRDWLILVGAVLATVAIIGGVTYAMYRVVRWVF